MFAFWPNDCTASRYFQIAFTAVENMVQAICRLFTAELRATLSRLPAKQRETVLPPIDAEVKAPGRVEHGRSMMSSGRDASATRLLPWRAVRLWLLLSAGTELGAGVGEDRRKQARAAPAGRDDEEAPSRRRDRLRRDAVPGLGLRGLAIASGADTVEDAGE
jgi:hypothetical protein